MKWSVWDETGYFSERMGGGGGYICSPCQEHAETSEKGDSK